MASFKVKLRPHGGGGYVKPADPYDKAFTVPKCVRLAWISHHSHAVVNKINLYQLQRRDGNFEADHGTERFRAHFIKTGLRESE